LLVYLLYSPFTPRLSEIKITDQTFYGTGTMSILNDPIIAFKSPKNNRGKGVVTMVDWWNQKFTSFMWMWKLDVNS